jgi:AraC-like DNA-binding protein
MRAGARGRPIEESRSGLDPRSDYQESGACPFRTVTPEQARKGRPQLLCLDPHHRTLLKRSVQSSVHSCTCPRELLAALDANPDLMVLLDNCPAAKECCLDPLEEVLVRVRQRIRAARAKAQELNPGTADDRPSYNESATRSYLLGACQRLTHESTQSLSLDRLASYLRMSPRKVNRSFHRAGLASPVRQSRHLSLLSAYRDIQSSNRSISEIAEDLHYQDASSFSRAFKRTFGVAPSMLRRID